MTDLLGPASAPNAVTARLAEYRTFGALDTWFKPCSNPASQDGTQVQAAWLNGIMAQLRGAIRGNGQRGDGTGPVVPEVNTVDALLLGAIQLLIARGQPNCGTDTGTADALAVAPATPWPEYKAGARIWVVKSSAAGPNATAAPTLAVSGLPPVTVVRRDGSALLPGDLPAGVAFAAEHDGTYFRLVSLTWGEIAAAVQSGKWVYGAATGSGNAAAVTLFPSQPAVDGQEILVKWPAANTAAAPTLNVAGDGTRQVLKQSGGTVQPGDLSGYVPLVRDGPNALWRVNGFVASDLAQGASIPGRTQIFTASGTFVVPAGVTQVEVDVIGGGGPGGPSSDGSGSSNPVGTAGAGGGGGGYAYRRISGLTPNQQVPITVGAGGQPVTTQLATGPSGGTSSFGTYCSASGGGAGSSGANAYSSGGAGGVGATCDLSITGQVGGAGGPPASYASNLCLFTWNKGGVPAKGWGTFPSYGTATGGSGYGSGGSGASGGSALAGAAGSAGIVIVRW